MLIISRTLPSLLRLSSNPNLPPPLLLFLSSPLLSSSSHRLRLFSTTATPYPLYYELIHHRPPHRSRCPRRKSLPDESSSTPASDITDDIDIKNDSPPEPMDRSKRKYYRKRQQRMFGGAGSDSDDARSNKDDGYVELKPEIVDFPRLHAREEELYFYDAFAYPWEKEKHYRMVYQLEKKYFPEHSLDKAFVEFAPVEPMKPVAAPAEEGLGKGKRKRGRTSAKVKEVSDKKGEDDKRDERALVFFDDEKDKEMEKKEKPAVRDVTEKKVEEFFKCLSKVPNGGDSRRAVSPLAEDGAEPFLVSRKTELPPRWDGPSGAVVLVDKPKGLLSQFVGPISL